MRSINRAKLLTSSFPIKILNQRYSIEARADKDDCRATLPAD